MRLFKRRTPPQDESTPYFGDQHASPTPGYPDLIIFERLLHGAITVDELKIHMQEIVENGTIFHFEDPRAQALARDMANKGFIEMPPLPDGITHEDRQWTIRAPTEN